MGRAYVNPPIQEVVCDFQFAPDGPWDLALPGLIYTQLKEEYPRRLPARHQSLETLIQVGPEGIRQQTVSQENLRFWRDDDAGVISVGPNRLSISHYRPYPGWEGYLSIIRMVYAAYVDNVSPQSIDRLGLRYVNRISFNEDLIDLEDYFDFYPYVGQHLPQIQVSAMTGVQIAYDDDVLRLQLATSTSDGEASIPILLDLDYFRPLSSEPGSEFVLEWLETAHDRVNRAFEGCLKDKVRKKFQEVPR